MKIEDEEYEFLNQEGVGLPDKKLAKILTNINRQLDYDAEICEVWDETDSICLLEI